MHEIFKQSRGWLFSAALHAVSVCLLSFTFVRHAEQRGEFLLMALAGHDDSAELLSSSFPTIILPPPTLADTMAPRSGTDTPQPLNVEPLVSGLEQTLALLESSAAARHLSPLDDVRRVSQSGAGLEPSLETSDVAEFFGVQASGNRFVFVVDSSTSMRGRKWSRACRQLILAIERLQPNQFFYVVFFDAVAHPMFQQKPSEAAFLAATPQNVRRLRRWLPSIDLGPDTRPFEATKFAMEMEPDAIFLLSDGLFDDPTVDYLRVQNRGESAGSTPRVVVHTIALQDLPGQEILRAIAAENGGTYQFVR